MLMEQKRVSKQASAITFSIRVSVAAVKATAMLTLAFTEHRLKQIENFTLSFLPLVLPSAFCAIKSKKQPR